MENDLLDHPHQIYFTQKSQECHLTLSILSVFSSEESTTLWLHYLETEPKHLVACVSASAGCMPPIWSFLIVTHYHHVLPRRGSGYYIWPIGQWMDRTRDFHAWFNKHFMKHALLARLLLHFLHGYSSHYCADTVCLAAKEKVVMFVLPPNMTQDYFGQIKIY